jgi:hypothetical protein
VVLEDLELAGIQGDKAKWIIQDGRFLVENEILSEFSISCSLCLWSFKLHPFWVLLSTNNSNHGPLSGIPAFSWHPKVLHLPNRHWLRDWDSHPIKCTYKEDKEVKHFQLYINKRIDVAN